MASIPIRFSQLLYVIRLGRPLFLVGGFLFHALGVGIALYAGHSLNLAVLLWGQVAITSIQLMTHYSNEYFDLEADLANHTPTQWSGGSRILPDGLLPPRVALVAALALATLAFCATLALGLILKTGPLTMPLLFLSLITAWSYSAPPLRLHSSGVGEVTTALLSPGLTPVVGFYLQAGRLTWLPVLAVLPLCFLQLVMVLSVHIPDAVGDEVVGKRTLVVRLGGARTARLYMVSIALAYLLLLPLVLAGLPGEAAAAVCLSLPLGLWQMRRMGRGEWVVPSRWNSLAFWSVGLLIGTTALETAAFFWLVWSR